MIDYILKFPNKETAEQFGVANGFASINKDGEVVSNIASLKHALYVHGEYYPEPEIGSEELPTGDGKWWVLFRDLTGIPVPNDGYQYIYWSSESGSPRPTGEGVPNAWWA